LFNINIINDQAVSPDSTLVVPPVMLDDDEIQDALDKTKTSFVEAKYLPNLTLEQLGHIDTAVLETQARNPKIISSLPDTALDVFRELLRRLPPKLAASIAATPGLLTRLSDRQIVVFSENLEALSEVDEDHILLVTNTRPEVIPQLPWQALDLFLKMPKFVRSLSRRTLRYLVRSEAMAHKLEELPRSTLARVTTENPYILAKLPTGHFPARGLIRKLLKVCRR
jgi:hypothetical protein